MDQTAWTRGSRRHEAVKDWPPASVVLVGDNDVDVCAAYHAGSTIVMDKAAWPRSNTRDHWAALGHVPGAFITKPRDLLDVPASPSATFRSLSACLPGRQPALLFGSTRSGHFKPWEFEEPRGPVRVSVCGRSFSNHASVTRQRAGHALSASIVDKKESTQFPEEWVETVLAFAHKSYPLLPWAGKLVT